MVYLKSLAAVLTLGVFCASAVPASSTVEAKVLTARFNPTVYACDGVDWTGVCQVLAKPDDNGCYTVPGEWRDRIMSIRNMEPYKNYCVWFENDDCTGDQYENQSAGDLAASGWGRRISSWDCFEY